LGLLHPISSSRNSPFGEIRAQLADRNTAGYDLLVGRHSDPALAKVQVKTVRTQLWYVKQSQFEGDMLAQITI